MCSGVQCLQGEKLASKHGESSIIPLVRIFLCYSSVHAIDCDLGCTWTSLHLCSLSATRVSCKKPRVLYILCAARCTVLNLGSHCNTIPVHQVNRRLYTATVYTTVVVGEISTYSMIIMWKPGPIPAGDPNMDVTAEARGLGGRHAPSRVV